MRDTFFEDLVDKSNGKSQQGDVDIFIFEVGEQLGLLAREEVGVHGFEHAEQKHNHF